MVFDERAAEQECPLFIVPLGVRQLILQMRQYGVCAAFERGVEIRSPQQGAKYPTNNASPIPAGYSLAPDRLNERRLSGSQQLYRNVHYYGGNRRILDHPKAL